MVICIYDWRMMLYEGQLLRFTPSVNSLSQLTLTAPSEREPTECKPATPSSQQASLTEGGGTATAVTEGVNP